MPGDDFGRDNQFNLESMLPIVLLGAMTLGTILILVNTIINKFRPGVKLGYVSVVFYFAIITFLLYYCIAYDVSAGSGD